MVCIKSLWSEYYDFEERSVLNCDIKTQVAIIGGGITGLLCAYLLNEKGIESIIIEGERICGGITKNTTAKITSQHNLIYDKLINNFGVEKALMYAKANELAIDKYEEIINIKNIKCDFERLPNYVYSFKDAEKIEKEVEAVQKLGIKSSFTKETTLPFDIAGAVKFENQAQFNPLLFLNEIAKDIIVYENTYAREIQDNTIITDRGKIRADKIIIASHFPFINTPGYYFIRMYQQRSYVLAVENAQKMDGMYIDADEEGYSFRNYNNLLLFGGAGHKTGKNKTGGCYDKLRKAVKTYYPDCQEKYNWSAQDCMTLDQIPYIGNFCASTPNLYVATGYNKWGMSSSMVSALVLSDIIAEKGNDYKEVFSPQRFNLTASLKTLAENGVQAVAGLSASAFKVPDTLAEELPKGHGGVVEYEGKKVGIYKDNEGQTFIVDTKCRHMGCQLEWNPDELTWDCPCHGSRYDYKGNLIDNPAIKGLKDELQVKLF